MLLLVLTLVAGGCSEKGGGDGSASGCGTDAIDALDDSALSAAMNEDVTVEGTIIETAYRPDWNGEPTFLDFVDRDNGLYLVVWEEDRADFGAPEDTYLDEHVCVSGRLVEYRGRAEIILRRPSQIRIASDGVAAPTDEPESAEPETADPYQESLDIVEGTITRYFDAINASDYATAWELQTDERKSRAEGGYEDFAEGHSTTIVSDLLVHYVEAVGDVSRLAYVTFTSEQDARYGPQGQTCTHWTLDFYMSFERGAWRIAQAVGHDGGSEGEAC